MNDLEKVILTAFTDFMQAQQAHFQTPNAPCYAISDSPGYAVHKLNAKDNTEKTLYYVRPTRLQTLFERYDEKQVKELLYKLDWLQKPKSGWVQQLYGKGKDNKRSRLGYFLVFDGIAPSHLYATNNQTDNTNQRSKTMNTVIPLNFENNIVRINTSAENPLFVAKDVAAALGYENTNKTINKFCKGVAIRYPLSTEGGIQEVRMIEEPDVYRLIFGSKLESAKRFQNWVFEEVLPSIRKTGSYEMYEEQKAVSQSEMIRYHNLYLKLLDKFEKTDNEVIKKKIFQQIQSVEMSLGLPLQPYEDFNAK